MIFENAFSYLPEILAGSSYYEKNYEASIVNAFSLAVLQALNARNVPDPLSVIVAERFYGDVGNTRHLRADLFVNTSSIFVGSQELARFGWRYQNWLEAKYFRKINENAKVNITAACVSLAADIVRLCTLATPSISYPRNVKEEERFNPLKNPASNGQYRNLCTGRYLLHVYDRDPQNLLGKCKGQWKWIKNLLSPAPEKFSIKFDSKKGIKTIKKTFPDDIFNIEVQDLEIQNFIFEQSAKNGTEKQLKCILSKIKSFKVVLNQYSWEEKEDRTARANPHDSLEKIREAVAQNIGLNLINQKQEDDYSPTSYEQSKMRDESDSSFEENDDSSEGYC